MRGYRDGENPARWRGHLDKLLPARSKVRAIEHHAALLYAELPAFLASMREQEGVAARALEFLILTAARTGEVMGAQWNEIHPHCLKVTALAASSRCRARSARRASIGSMPSCRLRRASNAFPRAS